MEMPYTRPVPPQNEERDVVSHQESEDPERRNP